MSPFGAALGAPALTPKTLCNTIFYRSMTKNGSGSSKNELERRRAGETAHLKLLPAPPQ